PRLLALRHRTHSKYVDPTTHSTNAITSFWLSSDAENRSPDAANNNSVNSGNSTLTRVPREGCLLPKSTKDKQKSNEKHAARSERNRVDQQCYRDRQRAIQLGVKRLLKEIENLKRRLRDLCLGKESRRPCRVVTDTLKFAETYIRVTSDGEYRVGIDIERQLLEALRNSFARDVVVGDVSGVDALMRQFWRYLQYFGEPRMHLEQVKETVQGVVNVTATLGLTVSVSTLCSVFPQLLNAPRSQHDTQPLLAKRLLGKRLQCDVSLSFIFDEKSGRVSRLEISVDWVGALLVVLGNLKNVATVLDGALVSG
ncbi:hypothetical protein F444_21140, partial [Phytophthora nicotianae P1976]